MRLFLLGFGLAAWTYAAETVSILTTDGKIFEGPTRLASISLGGRKIPLSTVLSIHNGAAASAGEQARIDAGFAAIQAYKNETIQSDVRKKRDAAVEDLTAIGLPVMTPLLRALKDTDQHEPRPLYRLFERLIPSEADQLDREASLVRLANGEFARGKVEAFTAEVAGQKIEWSAIRRLAVRRKSITKDLRVHSIVHCTQIEFMDTGIALDAGSALTASAKGFVRMSWDTDGWASDADGLKVPGPNYKTNLVDGHPFGALVGKAGASATPFLLGARYAGKNPGAGRLHIAINDNRHWQNNVGHFTVRVQAANAYDVGEAQ